MLFFYSRECGAAVLRDRVARLKSHDDLVSAANAAAGQQEQNSRIDVAVVIKR